MSAISKDIEQLHDEIAVLSKLHRATLAQAIFGQVANTKIQTVMIRFLSDDGHGRPAMLTSISTEKAVPNDGASYAQDFTYYADLGNQFNPMENGNEGMKQFLEYGIEWDALMEILDEIRYWALDIQTVFKLEEDGDTAFITCDGCWNGPAIPAEEEAAA